MKIRVIGNEFFSSLFLHFTRADRMGEIGSQINEPCAVLYCIIENSLLCERVEKGEKWVERR